MHFARVLTVEHRFVKPDNTWNDVECNEYPRRYICRRTGISSNSSNGSSFLSMEMRISILGALASITLVFVGLYRYDKFSVMELESSIERETMFQAEFSAGTLKRNVL